jgi:hypothetical protein
MTTLTQSQIEALETVGREIAQAWIQADGSEAQLDLDYDFSGDWQAVRTVAQAAGVEWEGTQPASREVWPVVKAAYKAEVQEHLDAVAANS